MKKGLLKASELACYIIDYYEKKFNKEISPKRVYRYVLKIIVKSSVYDYGKLLFNKFSVIKLS